MSTTCEHVVLDLTSEDEAGEWVEGAEDPLSAIVGVRSELAAGGLAASLPGLVVTLGGRLVVEGIPPASRTGC